MQRASVDDPAIEAYARDAVVPAAPAIDFVAVYRAHFAFVWRSLRRLGVAEHALDDAAGADLEPGDPPDRLRTQISSGTSDHGRVRPRATACWKGSAR